MNKVIISGRATSDLELKTTNNGISVCSFSLAVKRPHTKDTTDFVNCTVWRQGADYLTTYARKGDMIGIIGTLTSRNYEDKNGNKRTAWEVQADDVEILTSKAERAEVIENAEPFAEVKKTEDAEAPFDDQLPF